VVVPDSRCAERNGHRVGRRRTLVV
jgi:hypothetical protein